MALTSVRLVAGDQEMVLLPRAGLREVLLDVPYPDVREDTEQRTDDDGEDDNTTYHGATSLTIELIATRTPAAFEDELARFMHPRLRPVLVVRDDEWPQARRLRLRASNRSAPRGVELPQNMRRIQAQWRVPDGVWEGADLQTVPVAADIPTQIGMTFPMTFPIAFSATLASGATLLLNGGTTPSHFIARLYGPCVAPRLVNETTGEEIRFGPALELAAGEYVEIDTRRRSADFLSLPGASRLEDLEYGPTSWWRIEPGDQLVRYAPTEAQAGAVAEIEYRSAWL